MAAQVGQGDMTDFASLPTAHTTLRAGYVRGRLTCRSCLHARAADLRGLIAAGRGDVPLVRLRWRCAHCGHRRIDALVAPSDAVLRPPTGTDAAEVARQARLLAEWEVSLAGHAEMAGWDALAREAWDDTPD